MSALATFILHCRKERTRGWAAKPKDRIMSLAEHITTKGHSLFDRVAYAFSAEARAKRAVFRQISAELDSLTDRELAELHLSRFDIYSVARKHAGLD